MYLKSIDIVGYKSFATKTHLDLGPGITGIIGPNGCGKSNVMESVRWCLGEMSWKSLRADSMVDVIFAGTAKRPALSMAEVMLTFDNAQTLLPVQFSEVTVSRRLFRSGESAYFLNKTQCRLRDIRELFMDTGLGDGGYAIIDQGGVDFVLNSKPEDRREIFEEAAGVAKYKAKREEALRKLDRVEMDVARLQDSVALISEQVKKLDSDARKAKLYQKYKEDLVALETTQILREVSKIEADLESASSQAHPWEEDLGRKRVEMDGHGANLAAFNLEKANAQNEVIAGNQRVSEIKAEIGRLEERIGFFARTQAECEERRRACEVEKTANSLSLENLGPEMERQGAELEQARAELGRIGEDAGLWDSRIEELSARLSSAQQNLQNLKSENLAMSQSFLDLKRRLSQEESNWSRQELQVRSSLRDLEKDLAQSEKIAAELAALQSAMEEQKARLAEASGRLSAAEQALSTLRERQREVAESSLKLHEDLTKDRVRLESLEAEGKQNPYWAGAQTVLNAGIPGMVGMVSELVKAEENWRHYFEDALGERLFAVVCEDSTAASAGVELLEASGKGRCRFLVLSTLPSRSLEPRSYPSEAQSLLNHLRFAPDHEKFVHFLLGESYTLGKALFSNNWVCGGSGARVTAQFNLTEIGALREAIAQKESSTHGLNQEKAAIGREIAAGEENVKAAHAAANEALAQERVLLAQIQDKESLRELSSKSASLSTDEAVRGLSEMALCREKMAELRHDLSSFEQNQKAAQEKELQMTQELADFKEELTKAQASRDVASSKFQGAREKVSYLESALEQLAQQKNSLENTIAKRDREMADLAQRQEETLLRTQESKDQLEASAARQAELEVEAQGRSARLREFEAAIAEKEEAIKGLKFECDDLQSKLHELEVKLSSWRATKEALRQRLWDEWQLGIDEAKAKYADRMPEPEKIDFLKKRLLSLGNVNMAAPEEYEALSSRQTFLTTQIDDLNKAKEDLKAAIQKINGTTRENFRQTFTEVREHFRRLFSVLFEGGEADLILTMPDNLLETGIEIVAQPPGKRPQNISLLSGGEKTLIAIALLFAFFLVKPSPFCMLDEADAALDDANVDRFGQILREFQARTQFLIVSHNKRTMEAADVIYGVTMEEMGVSQIVSVDFRKKAKEAAPAPQPSALASDPSPALDSTPSV